MPRRSLCTLALFFALASAVSQAAPQLVGVKDVIPGRDFIDARRFAMDPVTGDLLVAGYDEFGAALKLIESDSVGPIGDIPVGTAAPVDGEYTFQGVVIDHAAGRYYVLSADSVLGFAFGNSTPILNVKLALRPYAEPRQMAINTQTKRLYITVGPGADVGDAEDKGSVKVVDIGTSKLIATVTTNIFGPYGVAVNETTNKVYVTNNGSVQYPDEELWLTAINGATNAATKISFPVSTSWGAERNSRRIAVDTVRNKIYAILARTLDDGSELNAVAVLNGANDSLVKLIDYYAELRHAWMLVANPSQDRVYVVTDEDTDSVDVVDAITDTVGEPLPVPAHADWRDLAVDPTTQMLNVLLHDAVLRISTMGDETQSITWLAMDAAHTAVNPATGKVYFTDQARQTVFVLDSTTGALLKQIRLHTGENGEAYPYGLAVNTVTNRVYVTTDDLVADDGGLLHVIDGDTDAEIKSYPVLVTDPLGDGTPHTFWPQEIVMDAARHRLFVRQSDYVSIVDTQSDIVDPVPILTVPEAGSPPQMRIAYNGTTDRLFALGYEVDSGHIVIGVYDPATKGELHVIGNSQDLSPQLEIDISDVAVNPVTNRVYVAGRIPADTDGDGLALYAFDGTSGAFLAAITSPNAELGRPVFGGARLVVNVAQNRVYAATLTQNGVYPYLVNVRATAGLADATGLAGLNAAMAFSEAGQRLYVMAKADSAELNVPTNAQLRLFDEPVSAGTLRFSATKFTATEGGAAATVTLQRVGGDYGQVSVQYATADGSALAGQDYTSTSGTLTWEAGDLTDKTFTIPVLDDSELEPQETVLLQLSSPTGDAELGTPNQAVLVIADNEVAPTLAPRIVSAATAAAEATRPFVYAIRATRVPRSFAATGLPAGLTLNTRTGVIRGVPTVTGTYYVGLKATNPSGTGVGTLVINVGVETRPDLTPSLTNITVTHLTNGGLVITGFGKIANAGTRASTAARTQMYISSDATYDSGDAVLSSLAVVTGVPAPFRSIVPALAKGGAFGPRAFRIVVAPARAATVTGKHLLLVVDGVGVVKELDDTNNVAASAALQ